MDSLEQVEQSSSDHWQTLKELKDAITSRHNQIDSNKSYAKALIAGCDSTAGLLKQVASSKNRGIVGKQNGYMMRLSQIAIDDSAAIRVITVITMLYLSPTVIGVSGVET